MTAEPRVDPAPIVDIVIPVYNEEHDLEPSVRRLRTYLDERFPHPTRITIADNASTDATWTIARQLETSLAGVWAVHLDQKGRSRALRTAWLGAGAGFGGGAPSAGGFGGGSGLASTGDSVLATYLETNKGSAIWIVAMTSAMQAGSPELSTGDPVMAMGGFTGTDPAPSLAQIQAYVASGQLRYVLVGGTGGGPGGNSSTASAVSAWVTSVGKVVDYGDSSGTLYDPSGVATTGS
jgi:Glycosyl transferase family 2